ncbi:MAG TPA: MarR family winged helix-turn-helix transcriptional regulator [Gammaproteobacteria bacterium]|nr:MarR family winged helix-turn-helix transcriptional regulator [Gammaproteobacteria bacterium]
MARRSTDGLDAVLRHWTEAVPEDRLAHLVKDAWRAYARALQMRLAEHAVSFGHWTFLRILWEHDGLTQRELSAEAGVMEPTTYAAVRSMIKLGYITRRNAPGNKKNLYVYLTPAGRALKRKLVPLAKEVNAVAVDGIPQHDVEATRRVLLAIIRKLAADEAAAPAGRRVPSTRELGRLVSDAERRRVRRAKAARGKRARRSQKS